MITGGLVDAAEAISDFVDALRNASIGADLAQKVVIAATPVIVAKLIAGEDDGS